ncbi:hypothetical protein CANTEDRAFT_116288 [Yamadazyma tenuis ATCC 10573]|uniref:Uncharacterized protein n=1 Tax=Candida tenuis (strain ATCC 10573 / BCRC 21748 / CBS 615 / JCM 9827 / NBRC 10315 / NRRL Y-1498 / VKM Y-70) TaxID=590646 RepID=G3BCY1_CANTC|nr:uncharacterized protein CANTEDRAFT_116288 [Yamadazyma tenuis ATCC 10573]EGV60237.1 hypothetical protein CANTEDRAFT_116288 [Yamadazyma tenuis ATCC 10573]
MYVYKQEQTQDLGKSRTNPMEDPMYGFCVTIADADSRCIPFTKEADRCDVSDCNTRLELSSKHNWKPKERLLVRIVQLLGSRIYF